MSTIVVRIDDTPIAYNCLTFSGGELHIQLSDNIPETFKDVEIIANLKGTHDLIELLLVFNALKHRFSNAYMPIDLTIPYMPYARQDRVCAVGQAFSMEVMAQLINTMDIKTLTTWDCHSNAGLAAISREFSKRNTDANIRNVESHDIIKESPELMNILQDENTVLICPDKGAIQRCADIKRTLAPNISIVQSNKVRDPKTGQITNIAVESGDLNGKTCLIPDDIGDGLGTFLGLAEKLKKRNAGKVILFITHGIFSKGVDVCINLIDEVYCSNSIPFKEESTIVPVHVIGYDN